MPTLALTNTLTAGAAENINHVQTNFEDIVDVVNALDGDNLATATAQALGVNATSVVRRGKSIIATEESTASTTYTTLATPDQVSSVVLPTDGLLAIAYLAQWKHSTAATRARAALFLNSTQVQVVRVIASESQSKTQAALLAQTVYNRLATSPAGLINSDATGAAAGDVTTGQILGLMDVSGNVDHGDEAGGSLALASPGIHGGVCYIYAAAGTYDVSVRFRTDSAGTVTAKERKLWVWTNGF